MKVGRYPIVSWLLGTKYFITVSIKITTKYISHNFNSYL